MHALKRLINRHRANRDLRSLDNRRAYLIQVHTTGGEIHHRIGAIFNSQLKFLELLIHITSIR